MNEDGMNEDDPDPDHVVPSPWVPPASTFVFETFGLRVVRLDDDAWFVLEDVCGALGLDDPAAVVERLRNEFADADVRECLIGTHDGPRAMAIVDEFDLHAVVAGGATPSAKRHRRWIRSVVLPAMYASSTFATRAASRGVVPGSAASANVGEADAVARDRPFVHELEPSDLVASDALASDPVASDPAIRRLIVPRGHLVELTFMGAVVATVFDRAAFDAFPEVGLQELAASTRRARAVPLVVRLPDVSAATRASWEAWAVTLPDVRVLSVGRGPGHPRPIPRS